MIESERSFLSKEILLIDVKVHIQHLKASILNFFYQTIQSYFSLKLTQFILKMWSALYAVLDQAGLSSLSQV